MFGARREDRVNDAGKYVVAGFIPACAVGEKEVEKMIVYVSS